MAHMLPISVPLVTLAGLVAGVVNTVAGSGSLVTYPMLLLAGVPPVAANITNTVGLAPGAAAGAWAYRGELVAQRTAVFRLLPPAVVGAVGGAGLLLLVPSAAFEVVVPVLILLATVLVAIQPILARLTRVGSQTRWLPLVVALLAASVYGGYFSAAQGVILFGVLGVFLDAGLQEQNALKNLLQATVNVVAAAFFVLSGGADFLLAGCVAFGSLCGAPLGAWLARQLPARLFRLGIVCLGLVVSVVMIVRLLA